MKKTILLTFDLEEFDLPLELKETISERRQIEISRRGLLYILSLLEKNRVRATFFTTAKFAEANKNLISQLSDFNEIALHGLDHQDDYRRIKREEGIRRLRQARKIIEEIIGQRVYGFRAPRFHTMKVRFLKNAGLKYDSSLHPTYIPGRYNNFFTERKIHKHGEVIEIPVSVTSVLRLPLFWFVFRNLGLGYAKFCTSWNFIDSDYTMLIFHPWEFINLNETEFKLPLYFRRNTGNVLFETLDNYIKWAKEKEFSFLTTREFLKNNGLM